MKLYLVTSRHCTLEGNFEQRLVAAESELIAVNLAVKEGTKSDNLKPCKVELISPDKEGVLTTSYVYWVEGADSSPAAPTCCFEDISDAVNDAVDREGWTTATTGEEPDG